MPTVSSFLGRKNSALVETDFVGGVKLPIPDDALVQNVLPSLACFTCANSLVSVGICTFYQLVSMSKKGREGGRRPCSSQHSQSTASGATFQDLHWNASLVLIILVFLDAWNHTLDQIIFDLGFLVPG